MTKTLWLGTRVQIGYMSAMTSPQAPLWKKLRSPDLTADALLSAMDVKAAPVDMDEIATKLGVRLLLAERDDSLGCLWFKGDKADLSVDKLAILARQRFTVATLLCHLLRHPEGTYNRSSRPTSALEEEALEFASALLMPDQFLRPLLRRGDGPPDPTVLAKKFRVSRQAMEMRLEEYETEFGWGFHDELEPESQWAAIGLSPLASDAWSVFGVQPGADIAEVKVAYQQLLGQYQPDKYEHLAPEMRALAEERTREINIAFEFIEAQASAPQPTAPLPVCNDDEPELRHRSGEVAEILKKARWWITNRGWCQGSRARDGYGKKVVTYDADKAGRFSIVGAVWRAAGEDFELRELALELVALAVKERPRFLEKWNDLPERTKDEVVQALDRAIRTTEEAGKTAGAATSTQELSPSSSSGVSS